MNVSNLGWVRSLSTLSLSTLSVLRDRTHPRFDTFNNAVQALFSYHAVSVHFLYSLANMMRSKSPPSPREKLSTRVWLHVLRAAVSLKQEIKGIKGVPITRMVAFKEGEESRISDKHMTWSLSRNGLYAGDILVVRSCVCALAIHRIMQLRKKRFRTKSGLKLKIGRQSILVEVMWSAAATAVV